MEILTPVKTRRTTDPLSKNLTIQPSKEKESCIQDLPSPLIMDILLRLPVKSLLSCRRVCKIWHAFLSDPHFTRLYLSRAPINLLIRTTHKQRKPKILHLFDIRDADTGHRESRIKLKHKIRLPNTDFKLVNSCNGLLCLWRNSKVPSIRHIYVCNPILGEFVAIPVGILCFREVIGVAFGFSYSTNEYKVIRVLRTMQFDPITNTFHGQYHSVAEVYVLGSGTWRRIGEVPFPMNLQSDFNTSVNGAIHWRAQWFQPSDFIHAFDFETEQFRIVPEPAEFGPSQRMLNHYMRIGVLKGCLSISDCIEPHVLDLWSMKEYGVKESWTKMYVINNLTFGNHLMNVYDPIMILDSGEILMLFNGASLVSYDPRKEVFNFLSFYGVKSEFEAIGHIPSFVSLQLLAMEENVKVCST